jgi:hypothetical protein
MRSQCQPLRIPLIVLLVVICRGVLQTLQERLLILVGREDLRKVVERLLVGVGGPRAVSRAGGQLERAEVLDRRLQVVVVLAQVGVGAGRDGALLGIEGILAVLRATDR